MVYIDVEVMTLQNKNKPNKEDINMSEIFNKATLELFYQDSEKGKVKKFKSIQNLKQGATHDAVMTVSDAVDTLAKEAMTYCDTIVRTRHDRN